MLGAAKQAVYLPDIANPTFQYLPTHSDVYAVEREQVSEYGEHACGGRCTYVAGCAYMRRKAVSLRGALHIYGEDLHICGEDLHIRAREPAVWSEGSYMRRG